LAAFVAPGPSEKIFRVLIGPLADPAAYMKAKETVDQIGLSTFARKFPN
jgi:cell division septation protein DedD